MLSPESLLPDCASPPGSSGLVVAPTLVTPLSLSDLDRVWERIANIHEPKRLSLDAGSRRPWSTLGIREFLAEQEGSGHWDFFKPSTCLMVSITSAVYRRDTWIQVGGEHYFKLHILLSGRLLGERHEVIASGPQAIVFLSPGSSHAGYFIAGGRDTRMLVLHCRAELLTEVLGLDPALVPAPFDRLYGSPPQHAPVHRRIALGPGVLHAAQRILESRHEIPSHLQVSFIEAMAMSVICQILGELSNSEWVRRAEVGLSARDLNRIYEARDYLAQHFTSPPVIPQLARMMGINQTKLKAGFKQVLGLTIYDYILHRRMERASELLLTRNYTVTAIAHQVGYRHAANFTSAFKRRFGCLPSAWKQPHRR